MFRSTVTGALAGTAALFADTTASRWTRLRSVVQRVVEHTAAISRCPDISDS